MKEICNLGVRRRPCGDGLPETRRCRARRAQGTTEASPANYCPGQAGQGPLKKKNFTHLQLRVPSIARAHGAPCTDSCCRSAAGLNYNYNPFHFLCLVRYTCLIQIFSKKIKKNKTKLKIYYTLNNITLKFNNN